MMSNSRSDRSDSSEKGSVPVRENSSASSGSGKKTRSQTASGRAFSRSYTVWKPRLDIPTA